MDRRVPDHLFAQTYADGVQIRDSFDAVHMDFLALEGPEKAVVVQRVVITVTALEAVSDQLQAMVARRRAKGWPVSGFDLPESGDDGS